MPPPLASADLGKTFNPLNYVVDVKGNRWSENLAAEVETVEELEQIASAQRKLMREAANIATNMQVNYIQVQTLLAARRQRGTAGGQQPDRLGRGKTVGPNRRERGGP